MLKLKNDLVYIFAGGELPDTVPRKSRNKNKQKIW